ncbi:MULTISPECIES: type II secretion system protein [Shewanella]|uniref:Prepilin-type N-terminal cleavage/methylation domain-containing protein n=1 Tax=Shewanella xiamenensis TaxID=332186 RepID=A0A1E3US32_9GAMM|nr:MULTISPECIES: prepilin-type N-terminal cleavage/methylation domain-containing protein [Shewanella]MBW0278243.1 pilus assembly protein PilD [Shewanella xiamenensis]MCT8860726.1 prepilin-type N-terminal cleavage/methylation domain-containing protein [Shewanella xiamenensis]MCT8865110.1 prepilin-type N-terminal cleavage/methylation domain-containing protein [Shewanella xiamenensis]MCT8872975.1 prepilin-type N-terminal cleavage/methylation domain-containing protein [Shewanella xiamenensis]MCT88
MINQKRTQGFTLIELVVVIIVLGILAVIAAPKFIGLSKEAREKSLLQLHASVKAANTLAYSKTQMPSLQSQAVAGRDDIIDIDLNGDGVAETRLKWGYLDNTDIEKWIEKDDKLVIQYQGIDITYIGYDLDANTLVNDDQCYFRYTQAADANTPPLYDINVQGC